MKQILIFISLCLISNISACNEQQLDNSVKKLALSNPQEIISDDFSTKNPAWEDYEGHWVFKNGELAQNSTSDYFPVILREDQQFTDLDISVKFKPVSGRIDASGGIIFRAKDQDNYYIVRANALEDNFRLYTFINGSRSELASATVTPPSLNQYHQMRIVAQGDHIQAYLDGKLQLDYHDKTFKKGYTGLWTKADSVTLFDDFKVRANQVSANQANAKK